MAKLFGARGPQPTLDKRGITIYAGLDLGEVLVMVAIGIVLPLLFLGAPLPALVKIPFLLSFPLSAALLYLIRRDGHSMAVWLGWMAAYALRQRHFTRTASTRVPSAAADAIDAAIGWDLNALSYEWRAGADGTPEVHVFETPVRPYRGWLVRMTEERRPLPYRGWYERQARPGLRREVL